MLLEHETLKMKQREEAFSQELKEWRAQLKPRKQVCVCLFVHFFCFWTGMFALCTFTNLQAIEEDLHRQVFSLRYLEYLPKTILLDSTSNSTPSSPTVSLESRRPSWGTQRTWSTSILPLDPTATATTPTTSLLSLPEAHSQDSSVQQHHRRFFLLFSCPMLRFHIYLNCFLVDFGVGWLFCFVLLMLLFLFFCFCSCARAHMQKLEETFAQQLEEQERVYGPMTPLTLPVDLPDLYHDCVRIGVGGSVRSSVSSVSEG